MREARRAGDELPLTWGKELLFVPPPLTPPRKGEGDVGVPETLERRGRDGFRRSKEQVSLPRVVFTLADGGLSFSREFELRGLLRSPSPLWGGMRGGGRPGSSTGTGACA